MGLSHLNPPPPPPRRYSCDPPSHPARLPRTLPHLSQVFMRPSLTSRTFHPGPSLTSRTFTPNPPSPFAGIHATLPHIPTRPPPSPHQTDAEPEGASGQKLRNVRERPLWAKYAAEWGDFSCFSSKNRGNTRNLQPPSRQAGKFSNSGLYACRMQAPES